MAREILFEGIASYPHLLQPHAAEINGQPKGAPRYSLRLILDQGFDFTAAMAALAEAGWEDQQIRDIGQVKQPWRDATEDGFPGRWCLTIDTGEQYPPELWNENASRMERLGVQPDYFYAGCRVRVLANAKGYNVGSMGVKFYLQAVQRISGDKSLWPQLGNRVDAGQHFTPIPGAPAQLAPTAFSGGQAPAPGAHAQNMPAQAAPMAGAPGTVPPGAPSPVQPGAPGMTPPAQGYGPQPGASVPQGNPQMVPQQQAPATTPAAPGMNPAAPAGPGVAAQPAAGYPSNPAGPYPYQQ